MLARQSARDGKAQAGAFLVAGEMRLHLTERHHGDLELLGIHAAAGIGDRDGDRTVAEFLHDD